MDSGAQRVAAQIATAKVWVILVVTCVPRRFFIGAQPAGKFKIIGWRRPLRA
jgi:hypothetical protein